RVIEALGDPDSGVEGEIDQRLVAHRGCDLAEGEKTIWLRAQVAGLKVIEFDAGTLPEQIDESSVLGETIFPQVMRRLTPHEVVERDNSLNRVAQHRHIRGAGSDPP